jgi:hypothetical protein
VPRLEQRHTDLADFAFAVAFQQIRVGVAGRNRPAEVGSGGQRSWPQIGEEPSSQAKRFVYTHKRRCFRGKELNAVSAHPNCLCPARIISCKYRVS